VLTVVAFALLSGCGSGAKPAATVNGHDISMAAYTQQVFYKRQATVDAGGVDQCQKGYPAALCGQLKASALTDLIDNELVNEYASEHHIAVSDSDFNREWAQVWRVRFQSNPALLKAFGERMHLSTADIKARIREDMLRQDVQNRVVTKTFASVPAIRAANIFVSSKKQSDAVEAQLRAHVPFLAILARLTKDKSSPCSTSGNCGDSGWVPDALLQPAERFLLKEPVQKPLGPYRLQQGYEYFIVEAVDRSLPTTSAQQVNLRALAFSEWLASQEQHSKIKRNVPA
jgi:hypothetical protein